LNERLSEVGKHQQREYSADHQGRQAKAMRLSGTDQAIPTRMLREGRYDGNDASTLAAMDG